MTLNHGEPTSKKDVILDRLRIPGYDHVYWVGRKALRLTFLSQQHRALNLIWALHEDKQLLAKTKVTVVGAGLAGLTAAFAAHQLGAEVTLIESRLVPLHLQRGCQLRFVHPHILDWPAPISEDALTDLPCLNWGANMAAQVANTILEQWKEVEDEIHTCYGYEVREVQQSADGRPLVFAEGGTDNYVQPCDRLILAVGFGLEKPLSALPLLSYWENDNFGRPLITNPIPRRYLISGCGDGGLVDAIRLRINAFDHANFVFGLSRLRDLEALKLRLQAIDQDIVRRIREEGKLNDSIAVQLEEQKRRGGSNFDEADARRRITEDIQGQLLEQEYRRLELPADLKDLLRSRLRKDTIVFLNGPSRSPLRLSASLLNRFVIFLLREYGGLRYRAGELEVLRAAIGQPFQVAFHHAQFAVEELEVHDIVVRHGPMPVIDRLFPQAIAEGCRPGPEDFDDPTREPQYPPDFLKSPHLSARAQRVRLDYAIANSALAAKERFDLSHHDRFGIQITAGKVSYVLRPLYADDPSATAPGRAFCGIPYQFEPAVGLSVLPAPPLPLPNAPLVCGIGIQNIGQPGRPPTKRDRPGSLGTLGCFVRLQATREVAIFTTASALGDPQALQVGDRLIVRSREADSSRANVIATLTQVHLPKPSSPRSSFAAETIQPNKFDAAVATLLPNTAMQAGFEPTHLNIPRLKARPHPVTSDNKLRELQGKTVFKVGAETGLTWGRIENLSATVAIRGWEGLYIYEEVLLITGSDQPLFSGPGDAGALVILEDGSAVGIILALSEDASYAFLLEPALHTLGCELYVPD